MRSCTARYQRKGTGRADVSGVRNIMVDDCCFVSAVLNLSL